MACYKCLIYYLFMTTYIFKVQLQQSIQNCRFVERTPITGAPSQNLHVIIESQTTSMATFQFVSVTCRILTFTCRATSECDSSCYLYSTPVESLQRDRRLYKLVCSFRSGTQECCGTLKRVRLI